MTLREQILKELHEQDAIVSREIKKCDDQISAESFAMSAITGGPLATAARSACQARIDASRNLKNKLERENAWVSEMLAKYK